MGIFLSHSGLNPGQEVLDAGVDSGLTRPGAPGTPADRTPQYIAAAGSVPANKRPATVALATVLATVFWSGTDNSLCDLVEMLGTGTINLSRVFQSKTKPILDWVKTFMHSFESLLLKIRLSPLALSLYRPYGWSVVATMRFVGQKVKRKKSIHPGLAYRALKNRALKYVYCSNTKIECRARLPRWNEKQDQ